MTGASHCQAIILLIDAQQGITTQTTRHASIGSLMGIQTVIFAINKMDAVGYSEKIFTDIVSQVDSLKKRLNYHTCFYLPISAYTGDNIITYSPKMPWFTGLPLLELLENIEVKQTENLPSRLQIQWVAPANDQGAIGYAAYIISGQFHVGDRVRCLPSNIFTTIQHIDHLLVSVNHAPSGSNPVLYLADNLSLQRGDMMAQESDSTLVITQKITTWMIWLQEEPMEIGKTYTLQHRFRKVAITVESIICQWDVHLWEQLPASHIQLNDIAQVSILANEPLFFDTFLENPANGCAILIDPITHQTAAGLMLLKA
jgi:sulfate adenylyltransferase subunit 1